MPDQLVLIVDDEEDVLHILDYNLKQEGYRTRRATTGLEALEMARTEPLPDIILLDLMLPDLSGMEVCRRIRDDGRTRHVPVVMLTAKGEEVDRVMGFQVGADDYVVKPFFVRELVMRVAAVLRRASDRPAATGTPPPDGSANPLRKIEFGALCIDPAAHQAWVADRPVALTPVEFRLLIHLVTNRGQVQSREALLNRVWNLQANIQPRTVNVHINRLREKLGAVGHYIETLHGLGYRFLSSAEESSD